MQQFLADYWPYVFVVIATIVTCIVLWIRYRRWIWDNIFGVAFAHCVFISVSGFRIQFNDVFDVDFRGSGPPWIVTIACAVLHFMSVNKVLNVNMIGGERGRRGLILVMSPLVGAIGFGLVAIDLIALVRGQEFGVLSGIGIVLMILCAANESDSTVSSLSAAGMVFWRRPATDPQIRSVETLPAAEQSDPPKSPVGREFES